MKALLDLFKPGTAIGCEGFAARQVVAIGLIDMTGVDDRHPLLAGGFEQRRGVADHRVEVFEDETVLLLHVDDQQCVFIVHEQT